MSDADDVADLGRRAIRTSRTEALRERMRAVIDDHDRTVDLKAVRQETSGGDSLQSIVDDGRSERV
ncbi:hypothetical protein C479_08253 [Halovivax asiaticus JCM 14624]|uniref:Uncharacterized protein n=1 Tax=Halovivax asiaticus JCM 14624 TaxID=1227490 RepID=M0BKF3_9EURY|nr:hypothetical protein [Halovivax asiaticus]ELZ10788.1 hypothetical protein C479_08253 [Halovivax asiaticus JCM 14624]